LIERVGLFDTRLGVVGQQIGRGEETDYFRRAQQLGFSGLYSAKAVVGHRFQIERLNSFYLYRYGIEKGRALVLVDRMLEPRDTVKFILSSLSFFVRGIFQLLKGRRDRFYQCLINIGIERGLWNESKAMTGMQ